MFLDLLNLKGNVPKVVVIDRDITLMNVVATIFPETTTLLCIFHIGKHVRAKYITNSRVKPKDVKVDGKDKEVKDVRTSEIVNNIMKACDNAVKYHSKESYVNVVVRFQDGGKKFTKFLTYAETTY